MKQILIFLGIVLLCWSCEEDKLDLYKGSHLFLLPEGDFWCV